MTYSSYLKAVLGVVALAMVLVAATNSVVDPFNAFGVVPESALGRLRAHQSRTAKAEALRDTGWDTVVVGTSRVHVGVDPDAGVWGGQRVYNAGLPLMTACDLRVVLDYVVTHSRPRTLVYFVEPDTFVRQCPANDRFLRSRFNRGLSVSEFYLEHLLSYRALTRAHEVWSSLDHQRHTSSAGFMFRDPSAHESGRERALGVLKRDARWLTRHGFHRPHIDALRPILERALDGGTNVVIVISPQHATRQWLYRELGHEAALAAFRGAMIELAQSPWATRVRAGGTASLRVWDFFRYSTVTTEPLPATAESPAMRNYIEPSHFRPVVGERVLQDALHGVGTSELGADLAHVEPEQYARQLVAGRDAYAAAHPEDVALVKRLARDHRRR